MPGATNTSRPWRRCAPGRIAFSKLDVLHRRNLERILPRFGIAGWRGGGARSQYGLASARRLAGRAARLGAAARNLLLAPVSNGNISLMVDLARRNGFPWDAVLGAETAGDYKPKPRVYLAACAAFDLPPGDCMMVAAHTNDLARRGQVRAAHRPHRAAERARAGHGRSRARSAGRCRRRNLEDLAGKLGA